MLFVRGFLRAARFADAGCIRRAVGFFAGRQTDAAELFHLLLDFFFADFFIGAVVIAAFGTQDLGFGRVGVYGDTLFGASRFTSVRI